MSKAWVPIMQIYGKGRPGHKFCRGCGHVLVSAQVSTGLFNTETGEPEVVKLLKCPQDSGWKIYGWTSHNVILDPSEERDCLIVVGF